ncbi:LysR family transcriptional regulator [Paenibacillus thiaminolyticus]|uniref:LysR family transcriptional regulator n=1 Tax=Paenibacillus thiaminolyticus TaxID=49283 RepID=A0AAP9DSC4_PANTH|nr:LysR family transcriptional regulator [Paenibacillus thiaminolyticus]MCY9536468.1 LysR family transcriptional regulator [Paenibacillus thiaminolyticus]MCY9601480.1 LysR family transcriptional regulator [Paenibacillus thiaminolyticus]MCY9610228.1 LysR family transcriptional regulator [Paenibacillus thiaminolyticus]MCY9616508.1 LysR family transcriptional regulator [Paenibacillus thiaminolyticus]MCY9616881.1 LysR family transcriptional regulator [Paenibacillus thiaminolyticus]
MIVDTLKVYVTVVEQCNFSRAAKLLNLSQPGVSMHIRNLENEFGIKLIHRSPRHVKTTDAGHILYQRAKQMLALYDNAKEEIHLLRDEVTGSLKVGASFTIGEYILPRLIADFARQYPQVDIQVMIANTEEIAQAVRANELDIGLVEGKVDYADILVDHPFMEDEMILVAPPDHELTALLKLEASMLQDQIWILRESGSGTRSYSEQFIRDLGVEPKRTYVFNSSQGVKEAVLAGLGIALLSRWVIHKELEAGELRRIHVKGGRVIRPFFILQDTKAASTMAMKMLIQQVRQLS